MKKDEIKAEALRLFARQGYHETSMDEIAKGVSVSKPALYYHYTSKMNLYVNVLEENVPLFGSVITDIYQDAKNQSIENFLKIVFRTVLESPAEIKLLFQKANYIASFDNDENLRNSVREILKRINDLFLQGMENLILTFSPNSNPKKIRDFLLSFLILMKGSDDWFFLNGISNQSDIQTILDVLWENFLNSHKF